MYDIGVHIFFPGNIDTPGYVHENKLKPAITAKIEEADPALKPEVVAKHLLAGASLCFADDVLEGMVELT